MERFSTTKLREQGITAFEAEIANYIRVNELQEGAEFNGVPGHKRYGASSQRTTVNRKDNECLQFTRNGKQVTIMADGTATPATPVAPAAPATTNGGDAIANALAPLFEAQRKAGRAEAAAEIEA